MHGPTHSESFVSTGRPLKERLEENVPELEGLYADLLSAALSEIDWFEIANNILSDTEGYEAQS